MLLGPLLTVSEGKRGLANILSQAAYYKAHLLFPLNQLDPIIGTKLPCAASELRDMNGGFN